MSRLFPDHIRIGLGASYAAAARVRGSKLLDVRMQRFAPAVAASNTQPAWQPALAGLSEELAALAPRGARVTVMLSAELAPLYLMPWRDDTPRAEQQALLAQSHFRRMFGEAAEQWKIIVQPTGYGSNWLACGMDEALLQALAQLMQQHQARLQSVVPLALSLFNGARRRLHKQDAWMLVAEPEKLLALHLRAGRWQLLHTLPAASLHSEPIKQMLLRETRLAGLVDVPVELFLFGHDAAGPAEDGLVRLDSGWRIAGHAQHAGAHPPSSALPAHLLGVAA